MRGVIVTFLVTRIALAVAVLVAVASFPTQPCPTCGDVSANPLVAGLARWDGAAYLRIARDGYVGPGAQDVLAFFPLYPALMRLIGTPFGGSDEAYLIGGLAVSNAATVVAAIALVRLAASRVGTAVATRAAVYLLAFPTTIFLSAVYADSLFIALAILSAVEAARARAWRSSALATGAALARPFGAIALIPVAAMLWHARFRPRRDVLSLVPPVAAFLAWNAYLSTVTGDPLAVLHGYSTGFTPRSPLQALTDLFDPSVYGFPWFVAGSFALFVALVMVSWRVTAPDHALFGTAMLLVIASAGSLASSMRYELSIFPAFMALAWLARARWVGPAWLVVSGTLAVVFAAMFAVGYWVG